MSLFFYLVTCDQFVAPEIRHSRRHCIIQRQGQDFDKKYVFEGVHGKEVDRRIF